MEPEQKLTRSEIVRAIFSSIRFTLRSSPQLMVFLAAAELIGRSVPFVNAWLVAHLITLLPQLAHVSTARNEAVHYVLYIAIVTIVPAMFDAVSNNYLAKQRIELTLRMELRLRTSFANLPFAHYEDKRIMDAYEQASRYATQVSSFVLFRLRNMFGTVAALGIAAVAFWHFSPWLTIGIFLLTFPALWVELRMQKLREQTWRANTLKYRKAGAYDAMVQPRMIQETRLLGLVHMAIDRSQHYRREAELSEIQAEQATNKYRFASVAIEAALEVVILVQTLNRIIAGKLPVGQFVFIQQLISQYLGALREASWLVQDLDSLLFGVDSYVKITSIPADAEGEKITNIHQDITLDAVSFRYPGANTDALTDITLTIPTGKTVAIVGENGAGKTTLIKLLMRIYNPEKGTICVGNQSLAAIDSADWHTHLGALLQDYQLFYDFTLRDNVWFGNITSRAHGKGINLGLQQATAADFIQKLPHGLDTYLGKYMDEQNGTDLSGGQAQRLAIARAFFRQPDILILDEPTSAIDARAEYEIFKNIEQARKGRTTIFISHRFSTIRKADYIYVLGGGRVQEQGTHQDLLQKHGLYEEMFSKQAEGYQ